jgi:hypothetical protein
MFAVVALWATAIAFSAAAFSLMLYFAVRERKFFYLAVWATALAFMLTGVVRSGAASAMAWPAFALAAFTLSVVALSLIYLRARCAHITNTGACKRYHLLQGAALALALLAGAVASGAVEAYQAAVQIPAQARESTSLGSTWELGAGWKSASEIMFQCGMGAAFLLISIVASLWSFRESMIADSAPAPAREVEAAAAAAAADTESLRAAAGGSDGDRWGTLEARGAAPLQEHAAGVPRGSG